jgi:hypothetical protein
LVEEEPVIVEAVQEKLDDSDEEAGTPPGQMKLF